MALEHGVERNIMVRTWGGIGDQICAEPTLRYALHKFKEARITLGSELPELFQHLPFDNVVRCGREKYDPAEYLIFDTIQSNGHLTWEFMSHMLVNCVDYASLCSFRSMLPIEFKPVQLYPSPDDVSVAEYYLSELVGSKYVVVHAGKHWPSKTFPKDWWNAVLDRLMYSGITPVLIGENCDDNRGTVDVDTTGCVDLRSRLSIMQCVALLQHSPVLITNDSSPLHMAASGSTWIGYIATVKHPDYITHWRGPGAEFGWRMENLGLGGYWDVVSELPNTKHEISLENVDEKLLRSWLPKPEDVVKWALGKIVYPG